MRKPHRKTGAKPRTQERQIGRHSNYEILRRLPTNAEILKSMCVSLEDDFAAKGLIEMPEDKREYNSRNMTLSVRNALAETAVKLNIPVQQVITLLVFKHTLRPSWNRKPRFRNKSK